MFRHRQAITGYSTKRLPSIHIQRTALHNQFSSIHAHQLNSGRKSRASSLSSGFFSPLQPANLHKIQQHSFSSASPKPIQELNAKMLVLTESDVSSLLLNLTDDQFTQFQNAMIEALKQYSASQHDQHDNHTKDTSSTSQRPAQSNDEAGEIHQPARTVITTSRKITTLVMPCSNTRITAVKTVAVVPSAPISGSISVYSAEGILMGVLNAAEITAFRTALVSTCVLRHARELGLWKVAGSDNTTSTATNGGGTAGKGSGDGAANVLVFGSGKQAEWHARLALRTIPVKSLMFINRGKARLAQWEEEGGLLPDLRKQYNHIPFTALAQEGNMNYEQSLEEALAQADVIFGTTPSTKPLFSYDMLNELNKKTRFIGLIGSYKPGMMEIDTPTLLSGRDGKVHVDSVDDVLIEAGEIIAAGLKADSLVEAGEFFTRGKNFGSVSGGEDKEMDNFIFKCVGFALMDLTAANAILELARELRLGTNFDAF